MYWKGFNKFGFTVSSTLVKLHWCIQLWEELPELFQPKQIFWTLLCLLKTVGFEYLTSFTSLLLLVACRRINFGKAEENWLSLFLLSSFSKQVTIRLIYSLSVCFSFFFHWNQMNLCVSLLVQKNCLRLEIRNRNLKLKIHNSNCWELNIKSPIKNMFTWKWVQTCFQACLNLPWCRNGL